ncbi:hypothetical protein [Microbacterium oleivorans]|uniref:Nuclear transport factor 2 family protein n=1 Tax=Microbacterium oleivorans TaxID=273677 RepID=A0A177KFD9_9MICO|nr:hypothetical protein [Microbacterium oleivorans]OAH51807.1 hypothetical protein AYL44_06130 [Microbacterium oleivorans]
MTARRSAALLAATALAAALTACAPASTPTPSPTPTGFASEEEAFAAAEATYRAYVDALNQVDLSDPATFEPVYALTAGQLNEQDRKSFSELHADGTVVEGDTQVVKIAPNEAEFPNVTLNVCTDVSQVQVTDREGKSLVAEDRPDLQARTVTLSVVQADKFRIARIGDPVGGFTCAGN